LVWFKTRNVLRRSYFYRQFYSIPHLKLIFGIIVALKVKNTSYFYFFHFYFLDFKKLEMTSRFLKINDFWDCSSLWIILVICRYLQQPAAMKRSMYWLTLHVYSSIHLCRLYYAFTSQNWNKIMRLLYLLVFMRVVKIYIKKLGC